MYSRCLIKVLSEEMGSGNGFYSTSEFNLDAKWLIDPKHLFVGPKIGEGAHAKVYEGKYVLFFDVNWFFFSCFFLVCLKSDLSVTLSLFLNSLSLSPPFLRYKNQIVAIKMVGKGDTPERMARREARFAREVAMLSKVRHKNLVKAMINSTFRTLASVSEFHAFLEIVVEILFIVSLKF